jgi:hypothetical protein
MAIGKGEREGGGFVGAFALRAPFEIVLVSFCFTLGFTPTWVLPIHFVTSNAIFIIKILVICCSFFE